MCSEWKTGKTVAYLSTYGKVFSPFPEDTAPENLPVLIFGDNGEEKHEEMAMGWKEDQKWYYAPQGFEVEWKVVSWLPVPDIS